MSPAAKRAAARPAARAARPKPPPPAGDSGTPLPRKLGIKDGMRVALLGAPPGLEATLGALPAGAVMRRGARGAADVRNTALAHGLVDFKICAVDADWLGLRFHRPAAAR